MEHEWLFLLSSLDPGATAQRAVQRLLRQVLSSGSSPLCSHPQNGPFIAGQLLRLLPSHSYSEGPHDASPAFRSKDFMLSSAGRSSGIVPPISWIVFRTFFPTSL